MWLPGGGPSDPDDCAGRWYTSGSVSVSWRAAVDEPRMRQEKQRLREGGTHNICCYHSHWGVAGVWGIGLVVVMPCIVNKVRLVVIIVPVVVGRVERVVCKRWWHFGLCLSFQSLIKRLSYEIYYFTASVHTLTFAIPLNITSQVSHVILDNNCGNPSPDEPEVFMSVITWSKGLFLTWYLKT